MNGERKKKQLLRKRIKELKEKFTLSSLQKKSKKIESILLSLPEYKNSSFPFVYVSMDREVHTHGIIKRMFIDEKKVAVPLVLESQNIMLACKINNFIDLEPGPWGILQPRKEKIQNVHLESIDLVIVPGVAFDKNGNRLGRGRGFYDRFLNLTSPRVPKIALAFSFQIVEKVPTTEGDIPVDMIVIENEVINCKKSRDKEVRNMFI
ncbi:MAG TPA: 5-formyltetrahydrofolate cyclo-ligase [Candidatus Omnitrophica bacterium]|nr:5-formyltetrahydrofolate cyclo-ligase [Candidatus Omnitrophota bacterium]